MFLSLIHYDDDDDDDGDGYTQLAIHSLESRTPSAGISFVSIGISHAFSKSEMAFGYTSGPGDLLCISANIHVSNVAI